MRTLTQFVAQRSTPLARKLACLYAASDILYNAANVRGGSRYRTAFEEALPDMMRVFNDALHASPSRMAVQRLKDRVMQVLHVWQTWSLYPPLFVTGLQTTFLQERRDSADAADDNDENVDGVPIVLADLDGVKMPDDVCYEDFDDRQLRVRCRAHGVPAGPRDEMLLRLKLAALTDAFCD